MVNGVFVNGQWRFGEWAMVNGQNLIGYSLIKLIYSRKIQYQFSKHHSLFTIAHSPFTIHHSMASPLSVPSFWMVDCQIIIYLKTICLLLLVIWAATSPSHCLPQILLFPIAEYPLSHRCPPLFRSFHTIQSLCPAKLLLVNEN